MALFGTPRRYGGSGGDSGGHLLGPAGAPLTSSKRFGFQKGAGSMLDRLIGVHQMSTAISSKSTNDFIHGAARASGYRWKKMTGAAARRSLAGLQSEGAFRATAMYHMDSFAGSIVRGGVRGAAAAEDTIVGFANRIDTYKRKGRGLSARGTPRFSTLGQVLGAAPLKSMAKSAGMFTAFSFGIETMAMGKPFSFGTLADSAWHSIPMSLSMDLAGHGAKGMIKSMGWQVLGEAVGLGPWGSLGLQIAGSLYRPGLGWGVAAGAAAFGAVKGAAHIGQTIYDLGKGANRTEFVTGDMSIATAEAATMRQRAVSAIQKSHLNMRSLLGNEASFMMGR